MNFSGYSCDKPTSRVLNPPGGRSNNIFGGYEEPAPANRNQNKQSNVLNDNSNINGNQTNEVQQPNKHVDRNRSNIFENESSAQAPTKGVDRNRSNIFENEHSNRAANNPRRGFNPITGKPYEEEESDRMKSHATHTTNQLNEKHAQEEKQQQQQNQQPDGPAAYNYHSSTKIHQPPGGKSTKLW